MSDEVIDTRGERSTPPVYFQPGQGVLELGLSTGYRARQLADVSGYQVFASDLEHYPLAVAASKGLACVQFDASYSFPFDDRVFDGVFIGELIEHIFDTEKLLRECHRVLKDRGILVITPNLAGLKDRIRFIFGSAPSQVSPLHGYWRLHIRPFTFGLLSAVLRATGFEPLRLASTYSLFAQVNSRVSDNVLALFSSEGPPTKLSSFCS